MSDPQQEYAEALAAYREAMERLQEAKRHIPPTPRDRFRQRKRERREAERARYLAIPEEVRERNNKWLNEITAKALVLLHQKVNAVSQLAENHPGQTLRIRMPVTYTGSTPNERPPIGNDDE